MAQIINEYRGLGDALGKSIGQGLSGFGEGFGGALQNLANVKLNQLLQRQEQARTSQAFQQLPGVTPEIANFLSALSPEERKYPLQNLGALMQLGQFSGQPVQQQAPQMAQQPQAQGLGALSGLSAGDLLGAGANPLLKQALSKAPVQQAPIAPPAQQLNVALGKQAPTAPEQAQAISDIFTSPEEKRRRRQEEREERKIAMKEKAERFKATQKDRKEITEKAKSARQQLHDLDRLEDLEKSGNLDTPGYLEFLKRSGLDIPALMNPESQEFQKIAVSFLRDAKQYFGARISNYELEQFLKTIPSLSQSPEGRKRVISNLKYLTRGNLAYNEALKEIMKENDNIPPYDLLEQIDDRIDPKIDKIAEQFKKDLAKPVPEAQNKLVTALQTILGSGASAIGSLANIPGAIAKGIGSL